MDTGLWLPRLPDRQLGPGTKGLLLPGDLVRRFWATLRGRDHQPPAGVRQPRLDTIQITGRVRILQGDVVVREARNHFVNSGLIAIINFFSGGSISSVYDVPAYDWALSTSYAFLTLGTNTTTVTTTSITALIAPIGVSPGTKPNSQSISRANPSSGIYQAIYLSTWNAGTVSGTIGEVGLWLRIPTILATSYTGTAGTLCSRLSVADADFTAYAINTALPLTVQWILQVAYA